MQDVETLENRRFADLEQEIHTRLQEWTEQSSDLGECFREVQQNQYYLLAGFPDLGTYCERRWGQKQSRVYQLINFADERDHFMELEAPWVPATEKEARYTKRLKDPEKKAVAIRIATEFANEPVTAERVRAVVAEVAPWRTGQTSKPEVMEQRARKRLQKSVETACKSLADAGKAQAYLQMCGPPEYGKEAWKFLKAMAEAEGW